jgi:succinyl-CoA synthetase beta subunit
VRLLEHQAKAILAQFGVAIPRGRLLVATSRFSKPVVLKVQTTIGGRGKHGGIIKVQTVAQFNRAVKKLRAWRFGEHIAHGILAEEIISYQTGHYVALMIDRDRGEIRLLARRCGGVDVEMSDETTLNEKLDVVSLSAVSRKLARKLGCRTNLSELIQKLLAAMVKSDALLVEINPLVVVDGQPMALDCKMEIDDNAWFRQPFFDGAARDGNFVTLNPAGNVAVVANGAGLAMATVDQIGQAGLVPTNFLDIGGGANSDKIAASFARFIEYENLRAIIVNIFAGITKCDQVARALLTAKQTYPQLPPLFVCLSGTNLGQAKTIMSRAGWPLFVTLDDVTRATQRELTT